VVSAAAGAGAGCGRTDEFKHVGVAGKVTLDGKPLPGGTITFVPLVSGPAAHATITDGAYTVARAEGPAPGSYRVEISRSEPTGRQVPDYDYPGKTVAETRNVVPDRYNVNSELKVDIKDDEQQIFDFPLVLKK
jgi:hypothetical protein